MDGHYYHLDDYVSSSTDRRRPQTRHTRISSQQQQGRKMFDGQDEDFSTYACTCAVLWRCRFKQTHFFVYYWHRSCFSALRPVTSLIAPKSMCVCVCVSVRVGFYLFIYLSIFFSLILFYFSFFFVCGCCVCCTNADTGIGYRDRILLLLVKNMCR